MIWLIVPAEPAMVSYVTIRRGVMNLVSGATIKLYYTWASLTTGLARQFEFLLNIKGNTVSLDLPSSENGNGCDLLATDHPLSGLEAQIDTLREVGQFFYERGWSMGSSSDYSVVIGREPFELLITANGNDNGRLTRNDFVRVDSQGKPVLPNQPNASTETLLHVALAQQPDLGAVLHTHSVWATVLSDLFRREGGFEIEGYDMLKGLAGVPTHEYTAWIHIFENTQRIPWLINQVRDQLISADRSLLHGFLIRRHGLYTWGRDLEEARRHVEIFEFLFECVARRLTLAVSQPAMTALR